MRKVTKTKCMILAVVLGMSTIITGCSAEISDTKVEVSFSSFTGEKEKEFNLNSYDNALNMVGTVTIKSGVVDLYVMVKGTDEILYTHTVTAANAGQLSIDIPELNNNRNLLFVLKAQAAKNFKISLTSKQKLVLDKEKPETPEIPKK